MLNMDDIISSMQKYCAYQDRSAGEVQLKMKKYQLSAVQKEEVIERLQQESFLDDERYAKNYVRSKMNGKQWGKIKLQYQLMQKGISSSLIQKALSEIDTEDYENQVDIHIEKWKRTNKLNYENAPKLIRFLASKGFENAIINQKLKEYAKQD